MFKKFKEDFQLGIVAIFGFCSVGVIVPFAVFRFLSGNYIMGVVDSIIVIGTGTLVVYALRSNKVEFAGKALVIFNCFGVLLSSHYLGFIGVFWMYAATLSNFFLTRSQVFAGLLTIPTIFLLTFGIATFISPPHLWIFLTTSLLVALLSAIVSIRYKVQKNSLEVLALVDPLTGAYNRRNMQKEMFLAVEENSRKGTPMAAILMDIDHFKMFNDKFGHEVGDDILSSFSKMVLAMTRINDKFFRYGGEEFLMLVKNTSLEEAEAIAEKIRKASEIAEFCISDRVTVSLGVALLHSGETSEQWVSRADKAMYQSKLMGRNQVCIYTDELNIIKI